MTLSILGWTFITDQQSNAGRSTLYQAIRRIGTRIRRGRSCIQLPGG